MMVQLVSLEWQRLQILIVQKVWSACSHSFRTGTSAQLEPTLKMALDIANHVHLVNFVHSAKMTLSMSEMAISPLSICILSLSHQLDGKVTTLLQTFLPLAKTDITQMIIHELVNNAVSVLCALKGQTSL